MKLIARPIAVSIPPESHPSYYLIHKYWARKPSNVVRSYIEYYTERGDVVLDPFAGSGVTLVESLLCGRRAVAVDLNPVACLIMEASVTPVDFDLVQHHYEELEHHIEPYISDLFQTDCRRCGSPAIATHFVWGGVYECIQCKQRVHAGNGTEQKRSLSCSNCGSRMRSSTPLVDEELRGVWWRCNNCGNRMVLKAPPLPRDLDNARAASTNVDQLPTWNFIQNKRTLAWPGMTIRDLFSSRNFLVLSKMRDYIDNIENPQLRKLFQLVFTSSVAQASKLVAFRGGLTTGGPAWTVSGFWIPSVHFEINAWTCFANRYHKMIRGKRHLEKQLDKTSPAKAECFADMSTASSWMVLQQSADKLINIPDNSVDYIFTDPPYGDSVPYLEYATLWAPWFRMPLDYDNEIVISDSKVRNKTPSDYKRRLALAFKQAHRVLKPEAWMSVTFNNRQIDVWEIVVSSIREAGFEVENSVYQAPAVVPVKSQLSRAGTIVGDIVLNCRKRAGERQYNVPVVIERQEDLILQESSQIVGERGEGVPIEIVLRGVILRLLKEPTELWPKQDIMRIIKSHFVVRTGKVYFHPDAPERLKQWQSLTQMITGIVARELSRGERDDKKIVAAVYSELRNGRAPSMQEIISVAKSLKEQAQLAMQGNLL